MKIKVSGLEDVKKMLQEAQKRVTQSIIDRFSAAGLQTIRAIRTGEASNWNDDTSNLRSSIGYIVTVDGKIVDSNGFEAVRPEGAEGARKGRIYAQELALNHPKGIALIVVAGMEYAAYVEDVEGKVVLAGGKIFAKNYLRRILSRPGQIIEEK